MAYLKGCVLSLTKKDLAAATKAADRAYDSRSCANMIKEGYQGVKKVIFKVRRGLAKSAAGAGGAAQAGASARRNEEWALGPEALALAAEHREMLPSLLLMVVGFDNLAAPYHAKIAKSHELGLNMHWVIRFGDHLAKQRLAAAASAKKASGGGGMQGSRKFLH